MSSQYFPPYRGHIADVKIRLDLTSYATNQELKNVTRVNPSSFALKTNLSSLKAKADKLHIDKLVPVPVDLAKLSNAVKNDVVKKTEYNSLKTKVDSINTTKYVLKSKYDSEIGDLKLKYQILVFQTSRYQIIVLQTSVFNSEITEVENKTPDITNFASKSALTAVENKIPDVKNLVTNTKLSNELNGFVKKTDYNTKITEIENKIPSDTSGLAQKIYTALRKLDDKTVSNASEIISINNKLKQANTRINVTERNTSYVSGKRYFCHDGQQNYLVLKIMNEYLKRAVVVSGNIATIYVHSWTSKGISNEQIKAPVTSSSNDQAPILEYSVVEIGLKFTGDLLIKIRVTYNHGSKVSIFIVHKLNSHTVNTDFALRDCLFGAARIAKDKDVQNYKYSGYRIGFDSTGTYNHSDGDALNTIIFVSDLSKSIHSNNRTENILVLGSGLAQKLNGKRIYAEQETPTNITKVNKKYCLSLHYDGAISRLFVNGVRQIVFTAKDSEITP